MYITIDALDRWNEYSTLLSEIKTDVEIAETYLHDLSAIQNYSEDSALRGAALQIQLLVKDNYASYISRLLEYTGDELSVNILTIFSMMSENHLLVAVSSIILGRLLLDTTFSISTNITNANKLVAAVHIGDALQGNFESWIEHSEYKKSSENEYFHSLTCRYSNPYILLANYFTSRVLAENKYIELCSNWGILGIGQDSQTPINTSKSYINILNTYRFMYLVSCVLKDF